MYTTNLENRQVIREAMLDDDITVSFAQEEHGVVTCAGMGVTIDLMLKLARQLTKPAIGAIVADIFLHENVRDMRTAQPFSGLNASRTSDGIVDRGIMVMQREIEEPICVREIAELIGVSGRSL